MKKIFKAVLCSCLMFGVCSVNAFKQSTVIVSAATEGLIIEDNIVTGYTGVSKHVVIPEGVTKIGYQAFKNNTTIETVKLANSVIGINSEAFYGCISLKSIDLGAGLTYINHHAFNNTASLKEIFIPKTLIYSQDYDWYGLFDNSGLKKITFENGTKFIPASLFRGSSVEEIVFPNTLLYIGESAFSNCDKLKKIVLPNSLIGVKSTAFYDCDALEEISLSDNIYYLEGGAFAECDNLKEVTIPKSLLYADTEYVNSAWVGPFGKSKLEKVNFEAGVWRIPEYLFSKTENLKTISIPDTVYEINTEAFYGSGLEEVKIPSGVSFIRQNAFGGCYSLEVVNISKSVNSIHSDAFKDSLKVKFQVPKNSYAEEYAKEKGMPYEINVAPLEPSNLEATVTEADAVTLTWYKGTDADKTVIYKRENGKNEWESCATTAKTTATVTGLTPGVKYQFKARTYVEGETERLYSKYSEIVSATPIVKKPSSLKVEQTTSSGAVKLTWTAAQGADKYQLYKATSKDGKYTRIKTFSESTRSYTVSGLTGGKDYYFKVRGYVTIKEKNYYSSFSSIVKSTPITVKAPTGTAVAKANASGSSAKISWTKSSDATYYQVYRATSKTGSYKKIKTVSKNYTYITDKNLEKGKTYYYKVRGYKENSSSKVYSKFDSVVLYKY